MSQPVLKTKKRKHAGEGVPSSKRTKTEKVKKDKHEIRNGAVAGKKDKGKGRAEC